MLHMVGWSVAGYWVEAGRWFVEKEYLRIVDDRLGEANPLHHPLGETADGFFALSTKPDSLQQSRDLDTEFALGQPAYLP